MLQQKSIWSNMHAKQYQSSEHNDNRNLERHWFTSIQLQHNIILGGSGEGLGALQQHKLFPLNYESQITKIQWPWHIDQQHIRLLHFNMLTGTFNIASFHLHRLIILYCNTRHSSTDQDKTQHTANNGLLKWNITKTNKKRFKFCLFFSF